MGRTLGPETLESVTLAWRKDGERYSAVDLLNAMDHGGRLSRLVGRFFQEIDALVMPTIARLPAAHGEINQNRPGMTAMEWTRHVFSYAPLTPLFNSTGQPSIALPLHWSSDGLPVGVQFASRLGDKATLLRVASQLEQAQPRANKRPLVHVAT